MAMGTLHIPAVPNVVMGTLAGSLSIQPLLT